MATAARLAAERSTGTIEAHWTPLDEYPGRYLEDLDFLRRDQIERADRLRFDQDRRRYIARQHWLRARLAARLGRTITDIQIEVDPGGKPRLLDRSVAFSAAHRNGLSLLAIGDTTTVGCDLEWCDATIDIGRISTQLSAAEQTALHELPPPLRMAGLYRAWTCKEAFLKATGEGLTKPLDSFDVAVDPRQPPALLRGGSSWSVETFAPLPGFQAAIVAPGDWRLTVTPPDPPLPAAP